MYTRKKQILITTLRIAGLMVGAALLAWIGWYWPLIALVIAVFYIAFAQHELNQVRANKIVGQITIHDRVYAYALWWRNDSGRP